MLGHYSRAILYFSNIIGTIQFVHAWNRGCSGFILFYSIHAELSTMLQILLRHHSESSEETCSHYITFEMLFQIPLIQYEADSKPFI